MQTDSSNIPKHVAIVMDGNGRWARQRLLPRAMGHREGVKSVQRAIDFSVKHKIEVLSLFALSVENFQSRPESEVQYLVSLFSEQIVKNLDEMHRNHIRIRVIGDVSVFESTVQAQMQHMQTVTANNSGLTLILAINYSGRWDIFQAAQRFAQYAITQNINPTQTVEKEFSPFLSFADLPDPDLLIRTSGEQRISNFMLWQLAYTELFFTDVFWPNFDATVFQEAIDAFQKRERKFGKIL